MAITKTNRKLFGDAFTLFLAGLKVAESILVDPKIFILNAMHKNTVSVVNSKPVKIISVSQTTPANSPNPSLSDQITHLAKKKNQDLQSSRVPTTRIGRFFQYTSLAAGVGVGALTESIRRTVSPSSSSSSLLMSPSNVDLIVKQLSRMRGAALKLGQMLSIQDSTVVSPELEEMLLRVQNAANYMPDSQLQVVMRKELGPKWESLFTSFDKTPFAAASIGQVHFATIENSDFQKVAVKVQYPGVSTSIASDLANLSTMITFSNLLPRGMYLDNTIKVSRIELEWECDYVREKESMQRFRELIKDSNAIYVPKVVESLSTSQILTSEFVEGVTIAEVAVMDQKVRDWKRQIQLLDFGATREFDSSFANNYIRLLYAAFKNKREDMVHYSKELGFLTGLESETMTNAHVSSLMHLSLPFRTEGSFDFTNQDITAKVRELIPIMLKERLTPPPDETYSLHRKLSGAFLLCARIGARVRCADLFTEAIQKTGISF
ncbi:hypothetical protein HK096_003760 [Nowakowskiella sp. JEL0078]|nr:hypothetical protein HK096_003760 [Nowakowskiella sp. JEL0078]